MAALNDKEIKHQEEAVEAEKELTEEQKAAMERALVEAQERKIREMRARGNRTSHQNQR